MRVTIESGPDRGAKIAETDQVLVGRDADCDLVLHDEKASRRHATLSVLPDGRVLVVDLGSRNGTFVDGSRIQGPTELDGGERVRIGDSVLAVEVAGRTALAPRGLTVRIASGPLQGREVEAAGTEFVLGRGDDSDLVLPDPTVSARHACLTILPGGAVLADLGSRNGTFVNGRQIYEPTLLEGGERVRLGDTIIGVVTPRQERAAATAVAEVGAWLTIDSGPAAGATVKVTGADFVIGRDDGAALTLPDPSVSWRHASLQVVGPGRAVLTDLGSSNGTFVDGNRIDGPVELRGDERVRLGDAELHFGEGSLEAPPDGEPGPRTAAPAAAAGRLSTASLARACATRPWLTIALWGAAFVVGAALAGLRLQDVLTAEVVLGGNPESKRADRLLEEKLRGPRRETELVIVRSANADVDDPAFRADVERLHGEVVALGPDVVQAATHFYVARDPALLADDRRGVLIPTVLAGDFDEAEANVEKLHAVVERADATPQLEVLTAGEVSTASDFTHTAEQDLRKGESIGLAVAFVVLLFVFGSLVASVLPMVLAVFAIGVALGLATLLGHVVDLSIFVTNMLVGMGLALGIDYSLFVLTRYREERAAGKSVVDAIETAGATSSKAVVFSGGAVVLALLGMVLTPDPLLRSLGLGAILVGITSIAATLTLLPAALGLLGDRVERLTVPFLRRTGGGWEERLWTRIAHAVMRRPVVSLVLAVGLLLAAAVPLRDLNPGTAGVSTLPDDSQSKRAVTALQSGFASARANPAEVVVSGDIDAPAVEAGIEDLQSRLADDPVLGTPRLEVNDARDLAVLSFPVTGDPEGPSATAAIDRLRDDAIPAAFGDAPAEVLVTGATARDADWVDQLAGALPFVLVFVLGLSFVLLAIAFRSIVVPTKAVLMNLLSVGAAYGLLVLVFHKGVGADLLGFQQIDRIEAWVPIFLFAVLFGLSMDYHVFLLSRIRERYNHTGDNAEAVAYGITTTARIITGAALIMVAVFAGFAIGELVPFQQLGFGMGVALLLDATIVRSVLVPAGMQLLGARNWYLPRWLRWLPEVSVEGPAEQPPRPREAPAVPASA